MHADTGAQARLEAAVKQVETRTDAEILIAIVRSSGFYGDADHGAGALAAGAALVAMLLVHFHGQGVPDHWVLPPVVLAYVLAVVVSRRTGAARRLLTSAGRRSRQVARAARAVFVEERVHATRSRKGVLVYVSLLESGVAILPDLGVEGKVDGATWNQVAHELEAAARAHELEPALVKALAAAGELLAAKLPRVGPVVDELRRHVLVRR